MQNGLSTFIGVSQRNTIVKKEKSTFSAVCSLAYSMDKKVLELLAEILGCNNKLYTD